MRPLRWRRGKWHFFSVLWAWSLAGNLSMVTRWSVGGQPDPAPSISALLTLLLLASAPLHFAGYPQPEEEAKP